MDFLDQFTITTLRASTPIILAAVAGLFSIRAGIFHLGIEGLMLAGAFAAVAAGTASGSVWIGLLVAILVCLILSVLYWVVIDRLKADPYAFYARRVLGLMPHPERFIDAVHHPRWTRETPPDPPCGLRIFRNAVRYFA